MALILVHLAMLYLNLTGHLVADLRSLLEQMVSIFHTMVNIQESQIKSKVKSD